MRIPSVLHAAVCDQEISVLQKVINEAVVEIDRYSRFSIQVMKFA